MFNPYKMPNGIVIKSQTWNFKVSHEGAEVSVEVNRWLDWENRGKWNYYIYVPVAKLADKAKWVPKYDPSKESWSQFDYSESEFNNIDFHGGVTYCKIESHGTFEIIKVGCDYAHIFDSENMDEEYESVFTDAAQTGINFLERKPYTVQEIL